MIRNNKTEQPTNAKQQLQKSAENFKDAGKNLILAVSNTAKWIYNTIDAGDKYLWMKFKKSTNNFINWVKNNLIKILIPLSIATRSWYNHIHHKPHKHDNSKTIIKQDNMVAGLDISQRNTFNLKKLLQTNKKKINDNDKKTRPFEFIFIRASIRLREDINFTKVRKTIKAHNDTCKNGKDKIIIWPYHYFNPNINSTKQFKVFAKQVPTLSSWDLPPVLDVEETSTIQSVKKRKKWIKNRLNLAEKKYGVTPILYIKQSLYNDHFKHDKKFKKYPIRIAHYNGDENSKLNTYAIHQLRDDWNVPWTNTDQWETDIDNMLRTTLKELTIK